MVPRAVHEAMSSGGSGERGGRKEGERGSQGACAASSCAPCGACASCSAGGREDRLGEEGERWDGGTEGGTEGGRDVKKEEGCGGGKGWSAGGARAEMGGRGGRGGGGEVEEGVEALPLSLPESRPLLCLCLPPSSTQHRAARAALRGQAARELPFPQRTSCEGVAFPPADDASSKSFRHRDSRQTLVGKVG